MTLAALVAGPAQALAQTSPINDPSESSIITGFTVGGSGSSSPSDSPIIKAVWEEEDDDTTLDGVQIEPQGDCNTKETVQICAVIEDNTFVKDELVSDIEAEVDAFTRLYYDRRPGMSTDDINSPVTNLVNSQTRLNLTALGQNEGIAKFCNGDPSTNGSIVEYYDKGVSDHYDYADICGNNDPVTSQGQLYKGTAKVFCGDFELSFEAAAGDYEVYVKAIDKSSLYDETQANTNWFTYQEVMVYELDFNAIDYGNIATSQWDWDRDGNNIGDTVWGYSTDTTDPTNFLRPTVRNLGNVEFKMSVAQGDMVNQTPGGLYGDALDNVEYRAKVGNAAWSSSYYPNASATILDDKLALSQYLEMDFAIMTTDSMEIDDEYAGTMTLDAVYQPFTSEPVPIHTEWSCQHVGGDFAL